MTFVHHHPTPPHLHFLSQQDVKNSRSTDSIRLLALLSLGEVGHHVDLSSQPELKTVILDAFSSSSEEVRHSQPPHHPPFTVLPLLLHANGGSWKEATVSFYWCCITQR